MREPTVRNENSIVSQLCLQLSFLQGFTAASDEYFLQSRNFCIDLRAQLLL